MPKTSSDLSRITLHGPAMGTRWSASLDAAPALDVPALRQALAAAVQQVDQQMSPWRPDSDLTRFNRAAADQWITLPTEMLQVLARAQEICRLSGGAFDPAVGALVDAWGFGAPRDAPDSTAISAARQLGRRPIDQWLELDASAGRARKRAPMQIDLCGIAKGYAVDRMAAVPKEKQAEEGVKICVEMIERLKKVEGVAGFHIMAIEWEEKVGEICERAGLLPRPQL